MNEKWNRWVFDAVVWTIGALTAGALFVDAAQASEHTERAHAPENALYRTECGACHVAYPPGLLAGVSWRAVMTGLDKHFGVDASVDPKQAAELERYLEQNSVADRQPGKGSLRISDSPWFQRHHREVAAAVWKRESVKSPANCSACHPRAEQGDFNEHQVHIPK